ncbi:MAG: alpha/beta hydrolase [Kiritimatiellae bacterium]|jgi:acetyl esterase/lipase|nr:alpha/beta hydrolase [Kiritimatiellia bacterium]
MEYHSGIGILIVVITAIFIRTVAAFGGTVHQRVSLWPGQAPVDENISEDAKAYITVYQPAKPDGMVVVICPGGGYGGLVTKGEGSGIAKWLNKNGITGVVLEYRLPHGKLNRPLYDAQRAIRTVRSRAEELKINPDEIGIIGFSAGGHLASSAATHFDSGNPASDDPIEKISCRPDFAILVYPVISMGPKGHGGSKLNLMGANPAPEMEELFSNEKQVTAKTPPCFLAHAMDDHVVSPDNSKIFYDALMKCKVPAKYLKLESGGHGLNGYKGPMWDKWQAEAVDWMKEL